MQDSESRPGTWNDAAADFLTDLSKAPQAPVTPEPVSATGDSVDVEVPRSMGPLLLAGLSVLGMLAVVVFCLRRPLLKIVSNATGISIANRNGSPEEIRSREDVISAFHALALNSRQRVESWWTHRAAAQELVAASPQQERAVQTLAEIYEQARYLPEDVELPADTIQSARAALAECR